MSCGGCKFWSEMIAGTSMVDGEIEAYCLHESMEGKGYHARMVRRGCEFKEIGIPIDHPALREEELRNA